MGYSRSEIMDASTPIYRQWVREHVGSTSGPVAVRALTFKLGIPIDWHRFAGSDILGFWFAGEITVNSALSPRRRRFTLAHELKHAIWDPPNAVPCKDSESDRVYEVEANIFGAELTMPYERFMRSLDRLAKADPLSCIGILAGIYQVSYTATAWRLVDLGRISRDEASDHLAAAWPEPFSKRLPSRPHPYSTPFHVPSATLTETL